jgi:hypothetical protein
VTGRARPEGPNWATATIHDGGVGVLVTDHVIRVSSPERTRVEIWEHHENPPLDGLWSLVDRETDRRWPTEATR